MQPVDGQDVNMLNYFKQNNIPHSWQDANTGEWMGAETKPGPHKWVIRDLRPFIKVGDVSQNEPSTGSPSV
jgi:hypothetical protein